VWKYCKGVLSGAGTQGDPQSAPDARKGDGKGEDAGDHEDGDKSGHGGRDGRDGRDGRNGRDDKNGHHGDRDGGRFTSPRKNHHAPDGGTSGAPLTTIRATMSPNPGPSPSYSAL
jgi:hypothetical protein